MTKAFAVIRDITDHGMTHPSDIAGLSERLRTMADPAQVGLHFHPLFGDAATALDSLSARVKEADEACQRLCGAHGFATGHGDSVADMIDEISAQIGTLEERALRAEQQRDEAYERAAETADCFADEYDATSFTSMVADQVAALNAKEQAAHEIAAAIRRLASGPEGGSVEMEGK